MEIDQRQSRDAASCCAMLTLLRGIAPRRTHSAPPVETKSERGLGRGRTHTTHRTTVLFHAVRGKRLPGGPRRWRRKRRVGRGLDVRRAGRVAPPRTDSDTDSSSRRVGVLGVSIYRAPRIAVLQYGQIKEKLALQAGHGSDSDDIWHT